MNTIMKVLVVSAISLASVGVNAELIATDWKVEWFGRTRLVDWFGVGFSW